MPPDGGLRLYEPRLGRVPARAQGVLVACLAMGGRSGPVRALARAMFVVGAVRRAHPGEWLKWDGLGE